MAVSDRTPLLRYLVVQEAWEKDLLKILAQASAEAEKSILAHAGSKKIGAVIAAEQERAVRLNLLKQQSKLWTKIGSSVMAARLDAAAAAIESNAVMTGFLQRTVLNPAERQVLLDATEARAKSTVDIAVARMQGLSYVPLSNQVYKTSQLAAGLVDRKVTVLLARGLSARGIANEMRKYIRPDVKGGVSYAAMRLGRTEINNAFHATQVADAIRSPFIDYLQWKLSGSHPRTDVCNEYASISDVDGYPAGTWEPNNVPRKPHPQCLCFTIPITPDRDEFVKGYTSGKYDKYIDDLMRSQGYSEEWISAGKK
jgi:hypothetical protein